MRYPSPGVIDVCSGLQAHLFKILKKCRLYGLDLPVAAGGVFSNVHRALRIFGQHPEALLRFAEMQVSENSSKLRGAILGKK